MKQKRMTVKYGGTIEAEHKQMAMIQNELVASGRIVKGLIGMGGIGKTFNLVRYAFKKRLCDGHTVPFAYVVDNTITAGMLGTQNAINFWYRIALFGGNKHLAQQFTKLKSSQGTITFNNNPICYIIPFVHYMKYKNLALYCDMMFLDEFIPEELNWQNKDIEEKIQSLSETLERDNTIDVWLCANPKRFKNPIMSNLGIQDIKPNHIGYNKRCAIAWCTADDFPKMHEHKKKNTFAGALSEGTGVVHRISGHLSVSGDHGTTIGDPIFSIGANGFVVGVYHSPIKGILTIGDHNPKNRFFCPTKKELAKGGIVNSNIIDHVYQIYAQGNLRYAGQELQDMFMVIMGLKKYGIT